MRTNREILDIFGEYEKIVTEINEKNFLWRNFWFNGVVFLQGRL